MLGINDLISAGIAEALSKTREEVDAEYAARRREADLSMCSDCGCWTGGADCPYCVPGAPHPRGRW